MLQKSVKTLFILAFVLVSFGKMSAQNPYSVEAAVDSVVTILLASEGTSSAVGSGLIVRTDGLILTPLSLVRGAREIQVRLRNGEIFDKAEIVLTDERRNVALLRISAAGLRVIPNGTVEETTVGSRIFVITNPAGDAFIKNTLLNSVQLADNIQGAGNGYRVLQFKGLESDKRIGGLVMDESGHSLGIINTSDKTIGQDTAVPLSSVLGLIRSASSTMAPSSYATSSPSPLNTPYPIPQSSVQMPQRGVTPLAPKGPGSAVIKPVTPKEILAISKTIYVTSRTVFFKPEQLINALNKKDEMNEWGLSFVEEYDLADLVLEIDHLLFTYKFTFKLYSQRLGSIIATGDVIIFDGNLGAPDMAKRVIEKLKKVRGEDKKTTDEEKKETKKDKKSKEKKDDDNN
ncbi:MAG TPA: trypsin-like peptidase domain-containing protein [Pyrinomonadaceae bacterium]|nr:trypsin-like peptidase domain-containing protein [Pyrinomonadaceae bacterium]